LGDWICSPPSTDATHLATIKTEKADISSLVFYTSDFDKPHLAIWIYFRSSLLQISTNRATTAAQQLLAQAYVHFTHIKWQRSQYLTQLFWLATILVDSFNVNSGPFRQIWLPLLGNFHRHYLLLH